MLQALLILPLAIMNIFDVCATQIAMSYGVGEANIVARWVIEATGFQGLFAFKATTIAIIFRLSRSIVGVYLAALIGITLFYLLISMNHIFILGSL